MQLCIEITQEDLLEERSEIRNKVIARVFKELNYIEQWGSGIRRIKSICKARGLKEPEIVEKGGFVDVSLYREVALKKVTTLKDNSYTNHQRSIIDYLNENENRISTKKASNILGTSDRATRTVLSSMVEMNILIRVDKGPQTHYKLVDKD
jgi:ATP-dependent DNA helicase RecG